MSAVEREEDQDHLTAVCTSFARRVCKDVERTTRGEPDLLASATHNLGVARDASDDAILVNRELPTSGSAQSGGVRGPETFDCPLRNVIVPPLVLIEIEDGKLVFGENVGGRIRLDALPNLGQGFLEKFTVSGVELGVLGASRNVQGPLKGGEVGESGWRSISHTLILRLLKRACA